MTEQPAAFTPNLNTFVSIAGFLVTLGTGIVAFSVVFSRVETQVSQQSDLIAKIDEQVVYQAQKIVDLERLAQSASDMASQDARRLVEIEARLRATENVAARADERMANILTSLARIEARLERIERNGNGSYPQQ